MNGKRIFTAIVLTLGILANNMMPVFAVAIIPPSIFDGTVKSGSANVAVGSTVKAKINSVQYAVATVTLAGSDTVYSLSVPGDDPATLDVIEGGVAGDTVTFYVNDEAASETALWQSGVSATANLTVPAATCYVLTRTFGANGGAAIATPLKSLACSTDGTYVAGQFIALEATPITGYRVAKWTGVDDEFSTSLMNSWTMTAADHTVNVAYEPIPGACYVLTIEPGVNGSTPTANPARSPACLTDGQYAPGEVIGLTAAPNSGYQVGGWTGTDNNLSTAATNTWTMAGADHTLGVNYVQNEYTLGVTKTGTGSGTVSSSPAGVSCGATCSHSFGVNTVVTLTAAAATGSTFTGWTGAGCSGTGTCQVTMAAAQAVSAAFTLNTYALTLTNNGNGSGTVTSTPAGINCGTTCSHSFDYGTAVTLTAIASTGSTFTGWSGAGCTGTGTCQMTVTAAQTVTATFTLNTYALTVTKSGNGGGTVFSAPVGIDCGATCSHSFNYNTAVTLTAQSAVGSSFSGWSGAGCSGTSTCQVTMTAAQSVTATFTLQTFAVSVSKTGAGSGTVTSTPAGINCGTTCVHSFNYNTPVTLTAVASTGSTFAGWSGAGCTGTGTCQVTVLTAENVSAAFTLNTYTLTVTKTGTGNGSVSSSPDGIDCGSTCSHSFDYDTPVTLTAAPATGSTFSGWTGGGCNGTGTCQVTVTAVQSVSAEFTLNAYALTISKSGNGSGTVTSEPSGIDCGLTCLDSFDYNTPVTLTAVANTGSNFTGWTGAGCTGTGTCQVTMATAQSVSAAFTLQTFTLSVSKTGTGAGTISSSPTGIACGTTCSHGFDYNTPVTLTANPGAGSTFTGWTGAGCTGTGTCQVTVSAARSVVATFMRRPQIVGNAGIAGAVLSYNDGGAKTVVANSSGGYALTVSYNWSGTITPSKAGYMFMPARLTYGNVVSNQISQNYRAHISGSVRYQSLAAHDGWVLESTETSGIGDLKDAGATVFNLGDAYGDRQYRGILSFNIPMGAMPANAVITSVTLKIKYAGGQGARPFGTMGNILVDVQKGAFSDNVALYRSDFQAPASRSAAILIGNNPVSGWYSGKLSPADFGNINRSGVTQFRLRFATDDNENGTADYMSFFSGDYSTVPSFRPILVIEYYLP